MKILVVEDDLIVAETLSALLSSCSFAVDVANDGEAGLEMMDAFEYDLVLLDVILPRLDGVTVCQRLREQGLQMPVLLLTGQGGTAAQKAIALNAGADDYIDKPFDAVELMARVQALLRRGNLSSQPILSWENLSLNPSNRTVTYGMNRIAATPKEYAILELFLRSPQKTFSSKAILDHAWNSLESPGEEAVRVHIKELRRKLTKAGAPTNFIKTVHRVGYQLNPLYSTFLSVQAEQAPSMPSIAELASVNQELRLLLEETRLSQEKLRQKMRALETDKQSLEQAYQQLQLAYQDLEQRYRQAQPSFDALDRPGQEGTVVLPRTYQQPQQQQWRALFDHILDAVLIVDDAGHYVDGNAIACELWGVSREHLLQLGITSFAAPNRDVAQLWQTLLTAGRLTGELTVQRPDGTTVQTEFSAIARVAAGHHLLTLRNITERKESEFTLREREEFLSSIYNGADEAIFVIEVTPARDFRFMGFNALAERYGGTRNEAVVGKTPEAVFGPQIGGDFRRHYEDCLQAGKSISYEEHIVFGERHIWTYTTLSPLRNELGEIYRIIGTAIDISDRKQIEMERQQAMKALRESERRLITLMDNLPGYVYRATNDENYTPEFISKGVLNITGYSQADYLVDRTITYGQEIHPDDVERVWATVQQAVAAHQPYECEYRILTKAGSQKWVWERGQGVYDDDGTLLHLEGFVTDVSDRKQLELSLQISEAKLSRIFANVMASIGEFQAFPDRTYQNQYLSPGCEFVYGYTQEEFGRHRELWASRVLPEDMETVILPAYDAIFSETKITVEYRFRDKTDHLRWISETLISQWNEDAACWQVTMVATDVSDRKRAEAALRQNEQKYQQILNAIPDIVFVKDENSQLVWCNQALQDFYGMSLDEIQGIVDTPLNHPDYTRQYLQDDEVVFTTGQALVIIEEPITRHDGEVRLFSTHKAPIFDDAGQIAMLVGVSRDITDRKQSQLALLRSEEKFRHFAENSRAVIWIADPTSLENLYVSPAYEAVWGRSRQSLQRNPNAWLEAVHPGDRQAINVRIAAQLRGESYQSEYRIVRPDGAVRWLLDQSFPIKNERGEVYSFGGIAQDITDQKELEISLQASRTQLSQILDNADAAIASMRVYANRDWEYEYWSAGCERLFGYSTAEYADKHLWLSRVVPEDAEQVLMPLFEAFFAEQKATVEYRFQRKDGLIRWFSSSYISRRVADDCWLVTMVNHDISDRKQAEELLRLNQAKFEALVTNIPGMVYRYYPSTQSTPHRFTYISSYAYELLGLPPEVVLADADAFVNLIHREDAHSFLASVEYAVAHFLPWHWEGRIRTPTGQLKWIQGSSQAQSTVEGNAWDGLLIDISKLKNAEATLQRQIRQEFLLADIAQDIRQSLKLTDVLSRTVERVRALLAVDRVVIFRFRPDWQGDVIMESLEPGWTSILSTNIYDPCFSDRYVKSYQQGHFAALADVEQPGLEPCYIELLKQFEVKASLAVPILQAEHLWGLLIAHHCAEPHPWHSTEIATLQRIATQVGIAIQQSELYEQTRRELLERARMQQVIQESEERFRTLSAAAPIGICQTNADGICIYTNARWHEMSGLSFANSLGDGWLRALHPDDRAMLMAAWEAYLQDESNGLPDFRLLTPQGEVRWVAARVATMRSDTGEIIGYVSTDEDITERKLADMKIREQAALLDIASDAIFVRDLENRIVYWNQGAERLYGWSAAEALGQQANRLLKVNASRSSKIMETLLRRGEWQGEIRKTTKTGEKVIVQARWTLVRDETGQPKSILAVNTDITEKKHLETQFYRAQRLESLGRLASGIAHDLNNVFTPILALTQVLRLTQRHLDRKAQDQMRLLEESAKRGASLVQQMLTVTRGSDEERIAVELVPLLWEVIQIAQESFPKNIEIHPQLPASDAPERSLGEVLADSTQLHQVFLNLLVNARDAMPEGGRLTIAAEIILLDEAFAQRNLDAEVGQYILVTVADTGTGITPEVRDRMFDPFFTTKEPGKGTGLGLATVLGIVKNYGGFVQVVTQVGEGTAMKVYLPVLEAEVNDQEQPVKVPITPFHGTGELIQIVEDDPAVQQTTQLLLESHDYATLAAADGVAAIAQYAEHQKDIHLVLLDITMPRMNGIELIRRLKAINPAVKIVAISGLPDNREPTLAAGAAAFFAKPYSLETLTQKVWELLNDDR